MTVYRWKPGYPTRELDAQTVGDELEAIRGAHGAITPDLVVEAATPEDAPLHPAFEWDDTKAATEHRRAQARGLIRAVVIQHPRHPNTPEATVRAFVAVRAQDSQRVYTSTVEALEDEDLRLQVLARAMNDLLAWRRRYRALQELADMFQAIDTTLASTDLGQIAAD